MNEPAYELALTEEEIGAILKFCGQEAILVGGQVLAVWDQFFAVEPTGELAEKVTLDVDLVLANGVMTKFLRVRLKKESVRVALEAVERVADIALDPRLSQVLLAEGIDLLGDVPVQEINALPFRERRWPHLLAAHSRLAKKNVALTKRRARLLEKKRNST